ncbi:TPA: 8-amino-7-oxononanoate synthase [Pasteurella multocida]|uniref:8-amino-7-oxononanoate synthase n=1 Tax=Pasteurella multocida TaxID=747 RepID=UPI000233FAE6|nr:8-amino-7-oxononanoate synthase [Pasteurella multocida]AWW60233.1 8-amino-7-oxononanoate synthase [Pasteurellaceae bacterium 12591]AET16314.1 8-amino-7-oxononanoate synthase/2-amino-3-ketobutyrate coenzyme A ligase [Pasteurella multocida 36950]AHE64812.1 8-amino-7-oxononanoate synthase/2-amino-3-ketobutyrate coenzyme A ligase [Pasteurella multocida subsp. multocida str. HB03]AIN49629.1 8-amino-7-oxononanoate synthase [Pasteurella multocida]ANJ90633.1 8-amino-7-oxononanoate synthase [Pasteur
MIRYYQQQLADLKAQNQFRQLPQLIHRGRFIQREDNTMLNMSSNDYLGLANNEALRQAFFTQYQDQLPALTSSSSRLLTGSFPIYDELESLMAQAFGRETALLFNSGYHANIGILPALADKKTLIVADKLVHASMIDGIRLAQCEFVRFRHHDYAHLEQILQKNDRTFERIIVVTESVFSMDGDCADLTQLVALKQHYPQVMIYVDEAHAIGVLGEKGLGLAEQRGCINQIDILVGTFGKALGSMGAYVICDQMIRDYLVNKMRPLIFSTALPPFNVAWTHFVFQQLPHLQAERAHLAQLSQHLRQAIVGIFQVPMPSESCIVPYILGDNELTVRTAQRLQQQGYYCLPIRPPTVPKGTSRIRFSLTADMQVAEVEQFIACLQELAE